MNTHLIQSLMVLLCLEDKRPYPRVLITALSTLTPLAGCEGNSSGQVHHLDAGSLRPTHLAVKVDDSETMG